MKIGCRIKIKQYIIWRFFNPLIIISCMFRICCDSLFVFKTDL